jgi:hypothetical protein
MNRHQYKGVVAITLGLIVLIVAPLIHAQTNTQGFEPAPSLDHPLLRVDMHEHGYKRDLELRREHPSLSFPDTGEIVFGWMTLDNPSVDKLKGPLSVPPVRSHLHVVVLDARNGQEKNRREWPSVSFYPTIDSVANGKFLICAGDTIRLLSRDFDVIRQQDLSRPGTCRYTELSPSRRSFSILSGTGRNYQSTLMDVESFAPLARWSSNEALRVHFTDTLLVGTCAPHFEVCFRKLEQPWKPFVFAKTGQQMTDAYRMPVFVDDSTLVITARNKMAVVTVDGELLFQVNLPEKCLFGTLATSTGSDRYAFIESKLRGVTNEFLDLYAEPSDDHVVVYSLRERKAVYTRKVKGTSPLSLVTEHENLLALSPDGTLLAIVDDGILEVYQLPLIHASTSDSGFSRTDLDN